MLDALQIAGIAAPDKFRALPDVHFIMIGVRRFISLDRRAQRPASNAFHVALAVEFSTFSPGANRGGLRRRCSGPRRAIRSLTSGGTRRRLVCV